MSRVIVKGLPKGLKHERLEKLFGDVGTVTDCNLKYTKEGVFRKFAFVGYSCEGEAQACIKHFNRSFIDTTRIAVEIAKDFGDETKPRAWSKYSRDSSAYQKMVATLEVKNESKKVEKSPKKEKKNKMDEMLGDLKDNSEFQEFVEVHKNRTTKATWSNDTGVGADGDMVSTAKAVTSSEAVAFDDSDDDEEMDNDDEVVEPAIVEDVPEDSEAKPSKDAGISNLDYLKSKMSKKNQHLVESSDSESDEESGGDTKKGKERGKIERKKKAQQKEPESSSEEEEDDDDSDDDNEDSEDEHSEDDDSDGDDSDNDSSSMDDNDSVDDNRNSKISREATTDTVTHVIKMKGLPPTAKEKQILDFFKPLVIVKVKIPKNAGGRTTSSVATVEFGSQKDTDQAMRKNKNFILQKRIFLYKIKKEFTETHTEKPRPWEQRTSDNDAEEETIAESGRLYIRNLSYRCKEDDLEAFFGKFGPLTEVHLPIDSLTRKIKGFAFVMFMMPEHAVQAYTKLDGTAFQGRMLHILPAKGKKEPDQDTTDAMSFKKKRELKQKQQANSSHNWNALFLGTSAVADVMADRYGATKSQILDADSRQSLGVRMALGETQLVNETKQFLIDNGVSLDAFGQAASERSKTVILVKNLPAGTKVDELKTLFGKHGILGRVVLPPSGVTGIVEFEAPTEARVAFRSLAYTKFQHLPLYLEWAPMGALTKSDKVEKPENSDQMKTDATKAAKDVTKDEPMELGEKKESEDSSSESDDEPEAESTIYVKNLNFESTDESLKTHFSTSGDVHLVTIAKKKDMKNPGQLLSMGYGFVQYKTKAAAQKAMKTLQHSHLDKHQLELKSSNKRIGVEGAKKKKQDTKKKQTSTKIIVRNVPFEAKHKEIRQLFSTFGELKTLRLPKKLGGTGSHRGFCFVDFLTKHDAKRAFKALCVSTRLYGRRLVLEWANEDDTVEQLRKKTADHFHDEAPAKRLRKSALMDELKLAAD